MLSGGIGMDWDGTTFQKLQKLLFFRDGKKQMADMYCKNVAS